ncbi:MAG: outer membrane beta-barrel protein [Pseudomonadota bacterium]
MLLRTTAIALMTVAAVPAAAQSLSGFTADAAYATNDNDDLTGLQGSGEFQITPQFGVGGSLGFYSSDDLDFTNVTARGLYYLSPGTAIGLFYAIDDADGGSTDSYGLEFGYGGGFGSLEAFFGVAESDNLSDDFDESIGGVLVEFSVSPNIFVSLGSEAYDVDSSTIDTLSSNTSIGARYAFAGGTSVFAEYGTVSVRQTSGGTEISDESEEYIAIGAQFDFGPTNGSVMSNRSTVRAVGF